MTVAKVGNIISFRDGMRGKVVAVLQNTVVADLTIMPEFESLKLEKDREVLRHEEYRVVE
ncbi:YkvS family protein [Pueribacillus sp. YX66]|uniref:YkvS family protein n=1 Tax=Pueribacillus sp. YX66 TaxID=3229242 RepID=UPI00358CDFFD